MSKSEADIEREAERRMNVFDRGYQRGELTDAMYGQLVQDLEEWTQQQLCKHILKFNSEFWLTCIKCGAQPYKCEEAQ